MAQGQEHEQELVEEEERRPRGSRRAKPRRGNCLWQEIRWPAVGAASSRRVPQFAPRQVHSRPRGKRESQELAQGVPQPSFLQSSCMTRPISTSASASR